MADWKHIFKRRPAWLYLQAARFCPNRIVTVVNQDGVYQLYSWDLERGDLVRLTDFPEGKLFGSIAADGQSIYYLNDKGGGEWGHFVRVPFHGGSPIDITPDVPPYYGYGLETDRSGRHIVFTAATTAGNTVYYVVLGVSGQPERVTCLRTSSAVVGAAIISPAADNVVWTETASTGEVTLWRVSLGSTMIPVSVSLSDLTPLAFPYLSNGSLLAMSVIGGFRRPGWLDVSRGAFEPIEIGITEGDLEIMAWDEERSQLLFCHLTHGHERLLVFNLQSRAVIPISLPEGAFDFVYPYANFQSDGSIIFRWQTFDIPPSPFRASGTDFKMIAPVLPATATVAPSHLQEALCSSSDGAVVQIRYALPETARGPVPFILDIHGGPHGIVSDRYNEAAQAWLANGFGYCAVNYRGSLGFGDDFKKSIYGHPGIYESDDVAAAAHWLVGQGLADSERFVLYGYSWGGYVTLLALGRFPTLFAGGIAGVAIADAIKNYEESPEYFKALDHLYFGGTPDEVPEVYRAGSPLTYLPAVERPILMIQGRNDARCPAGQAEAYKAEADRLGKKVTIEWYDAGHVGDYANSELRVRNFEKALAFARRIIEHKK